MAKQKHKRAFKKAIAVIGEGDTEKAYFKYIQITKRYHFKLKPDLARPSNYIDLFSKAKDLRNEKYDLIFCVLDIDTIIRENHLADFIAKCKRLPKNIIPIVSNPCFEFWLLLHYLSTPSSRFYDRCEQVVREVKKYLPDYDKKRIGIQGQKLFEKIGTENNTLKALENSAFLLNELKESKEVETSSFSEVSLVVNQLETCSKCNFSINCEKCKKLTTSYFK